MKPTQSVPPRILTDRTTEPAIEVGKRTVERGDEVTVSQLGRCIFRQHVTKDDGGEWIDVFTARGFARTVRSDRITRVHRTRRIGKAEA